MNKTKILRRTLLFRNLDAEALKSLAKESVEQHFSRDAVLFFEGETALGLFVIAGGSVRGFRIGADGREQVIFVERAPATVAEVPVFDNGAYFSTVAAEEETDVLFIEKKSIRRLCLANPTFALNALEVLAQRVRNLADLVEELALHEVGERLAHFLLSEGIKRGEMKDRELHLKLNLTRSQIAARIGTVREVVSRNLMRFQSEGLLRFENRHLIITDQTRLLQSKNKGKE
jgi:CRP/FNR family transcriptional regulator